jgi:hypothetical protein
VLNGNASLVERCEMGVKAAQLRDRTEPIFSMPLPLALSPL